jgi:hypothetical protein
VWFRPRLRVHKTSHRTTRRIYYRTTKPYEGRLRLFGVSSMVSSAPTHEKWKTFWYSLVFGVRTTLVPWINVRGGSLEVPWDAVEIELPLSRWRVDAFFGQFSFLDSFGSLWHDRPTPWRNSTPKMSAQFGCWRPIPLQPIHPRSTSHVVFALLSYLS